MRDKISGAVAVVLSLLLPIGAAADTIFQLDTPPAGSTVAGIVEVAGWILDDGQSCGSPANWQACDWTDALVSNIDLYVDGVFVASADMNLPRWDVLQAYPWYAGTPYNRPGFSTSFNAESLTDGMHTLFVRVRYSNGSVHDYGTRQVLVDRVINQAPFGELEMPGEYQPMTGVFPVTGWAIDSGSIEDVEVLIDGQVVGHAVTGIHRPDIGNRFPSHPGSDYSGFIRMLNTSEIINGIHVLAIRIRDNEGATRLIGRRFVQVSNVGHNLAPFGAIDWPIANHIMYSPDCALGPGISIPADPNEHPRGVELISGWALDVGSSTDRGGVKWVEVLINGSLLANTLVDDFYFSYFDMDVNYYGHERLDVMRMFPDVPNAKHSGFTFIVDVSDLIVNRDFHQGLHYLKIRAGDIENYVSDIAQIPVIFDCNDDPDRPSFGDIHTPVHMERINGVFDVTGWAADQDRVIAVEIWIDGEFVGFASHTLPSPYVREQFPWYPSITVDHSGYLYELDTTTLTDGEHVLVVRTEDRYGGITIVGERTFVVDNLN
jgi:hypothetical protein